MPNDDDVLAGELQTIDDASTDIEVSPEPSAPAREEPSEPLSREDLEREAAEEGETGVTLEALVDKDEITLADLRQFSAAKGLTDAELIELAAQSGLKLAGQSTAVAKQTTATAAVQRAWKAINGEGKELDLAKATLQDFLNGKIGYKALQKEQVRSVDELVRLAQSLAPAEQRIVALTADRQMLADRLAQQSERISTSDKERQAWNMILSDRSGTSFLKAQERYFEALAKGPEPVATESPEQIEARGVQMYYREIYPALQRINAAFPGSKLDEIDKVAQYLIGQEPLGQLGKDAAIERIKYIVNVQIPQMLEEKGYAYTETSVEGAKIVPSIGAGAVEAPAQVVPSVGKQVNRAEELRLRAENANLKNALRKQRLAGSPGAGSRAGSGEGERTGQRSLDQALEGKSASEAREILRGLK